MSWWSKVKAWWTGEPEEQAPTPAQEAADRLKQPEPQRTDAKHPDQPESEPIGNPALPRQPGPGEVVEPVLDSQGRVKRFDIIPKPESKPAEPSPEVPFMVATFRLPGSDGERDKWRLCGLARKAPGAPALCTVHLDDEDIDGFWGDMLPREGEQPQWRRIRYDRSTGLTLNSQVTAIPSNDDPSEWFYYLIVENPPKGITPGCWHVRSR
jgi:hypothetical protein